jgi:hypothetical protein
MCSVDRNSDAFKFIEIAQIAAAFEMQGFKSVKLNEKLAVNIMALPDSDLIPSTAANLLHDLAMLNFQDKAVFEKLVCLLLLNTTVLCHATRFHDAPLHRVEGELTNGMIGRSTRNAKARRETRRVIGLLLFRTLFTLS